MTLLAVMGDDVLYRAEFNVMRALLVVHERDGRATVRSVATEADRNVSSVHALLVRLAGRGLVAGVGDGTTGALRPLVRPVRWGRAA